MGRDDNVPAADRGGVLPLTDGDGETLSAAAQLDRENQVSDAAAGTIWALCHILGLTPDTVHRMSIDPDAGVITAEVWAGRAEPAPWGPRGTLRPVVETRRWTYRTPEAIAIDLVTRAADAQ